MKILTVHERRCKGLVLLYLFCGYIFFSNRFNFLKDNFFVCMGMFFSSNELAANVLAYCSIQRGTKAHQNRRSGYEISEFVMLSHTENFERHYLRLIHMAPILNFSAKAGQDPK